MAALRIELFGAPRLSGESGLLPPFPTQRATSLFSFLVVHRGHFYPRETLAGLFCGDSTDGQALKHLRTDLWRIRDTLRKASDTACACLVVEPRRVGFDAQADYWLDVQEFEQRLAAAEREEREGSPDAGRHLDEAIDLYRGDLLQGIYDDWCFHEQERCRALYLRALERAMHGHAGAGRIHRAVDLGLLLLEGDPLRESIHREVMRLQYRGGDRPAALRQFLRCAEILRQELDVEPMGETKALHRLILAEAPILDAASPPSFAPPTRRPTAAAPAGELDAAADELRRAQSHLVSALRRLDRRSERERQP